VLGSGALAAGATNASSTFSGAISGTGGSFTKSGTGTLTLDGTTANTLSGTFNVNDGTVLLAKTAGLDATGTGALNIGDGTGAAASALVQLNAANQINDGAAVTINADGRLNLNGNSETIGSLASSAAASTVTLGAGTLTTGGNNGSTTFAGVVSGTGGLTKVGTGTMTLTNANSYTGATTISAGTLALGAGGSLSSSTTLTISSGAGLTLAGGVSQTVVGINASTGSSVSIAAGATLTVTTNNASSLLSTVSGTGLLAFTGTGNVTLGTSFNFGGEVDIGGGLTGTPVKTLFLTGNVSIATLKITGDTILDFGGSSATTLTVGSFAILNGAKVTITNWVNLSDLFVAQNFGNGTTSAALDVRGAAPQNQVTFTGYSNNQTVWQSYDHEITPAPEPSTYGAIFVGGAMASFGLYRWRQRRKRAGA
jgi:fibronectin-binding autotransporter adhesin